MRQRFSSRCDALHVASMHAQNAQNIIDSLLSCTSSTLPTGEVLLRYYNQLICSYAYAPNKTVQRTIEREWLRLSAHCKTLFASSRASRIAENEGMPWQLTETSFSPHFLRWLRGQKQCDIEAVLNGSKRGFLNNILTHSLHSLLGSETAAGLDNEHLLERLRVAPRRRLEYILLQLERFEAFPALEEYFMEQLGVRVRVKPKHSAFCRSGNRLSFIKQYYHTEILKRFDHESLIQQALPAQRWLRTSERDELCTRIKRSMVLTARETDPATYLDENSLRLYELERGISVALYGIESKRQLPLESYIGYTLFKNGLACAYGGAWVFGHHATFGINIHEAFRGGESGFVLCQLLRVYTQLFDLHTIEVEPYQYGLDNPEGISTAAFWFYYRYGFRPIDSRLAARAKREQERMKSDPSHRSSVRTLKAFTASNIMRSSVSTKTLRVPDVSYAVLKMIARHYHNDDHAAARDAVRRVLHLAPRLKKTAETHTRHFEEFALWALSAGSLNARTAPMIGALARLKAEEPYAFQKQLRRFVDLVR